MGFAKMMSAFNKVQPAISAVSGCATVAGAVFSIIGSQQTAEFEQQLLDYEKQLVGQLTQVNQHLASIEDELLDIKIELADILNESKDIELMKDITNLETWLDVMNSVIPGVSDKESYKRDALEILDAGSARSVVWSMNNIHNFLVHRVFARKSELHGQITVSAFLYVRAKLVQGLYLLGFACAYARRDYGYFLKEWSQKFYQQMKMLLDYSEQASTWNQTVASYKTNWDYGLPLSAGSPLMALDTIVLAPLLDPDPPVDLKIKDATGGYTLVFKSMDESEKQWWHRNKLSLADGQCRLGFPDPAFEKARSLDEAQGEWQQELGEYLYGKAGSGYNLVHGYSQATLLLHFNNMFPIDSEEKVRAAEKSGSVSALFLDVNGLVQREVWLQRPPGQESLDTEALVLSFAHRRDESIVYLGSSDGQPHWIEKGMEKADYFYLYDGKEKDKLLTFDLEKMTVTPKALSELTSLTSALWRVHSMNEAPLITIEPSGPADGHRLLLDKDQNWILLNTQKATPLFYVYEVTVPDKPQPLANPYKMKPVWAELKPHKSHGLDGVMKEIVFHKSPFVPSAQEMQVTRGS